MPRRCSSSTTLCLELWKSLISPSAWMSRITCSEEQGIEPCLWSSLGDAASEDYLTYRMWTASSPEYCSRSVPCGSVREGDDWELHPPHSDIQGLPEGNSWQLPSAGSDASSWPMQLLPCQ
ncbi:uncharacterized protein AAGF69_016997 isoform 2-T2 [Amazona ochrocephala]